MSVSKFLHSTIFNTLILVCLFPLLFGCSNEIPLKEDFASVSIDLGYGSKSLSLSAASDNLVYRYYARPASETDNPDEGLWPVMIVQNNKALITNLKPGSYTLFVCAFAEQTKVCQGSQSITLVSGQQNSISMSLTQLASGSTGQVRFDFTGSCDSVSVTCRKIGSSQSKTISVTGAGSPEKRFTGTDILECGNWVAEITFFKNRVQAGGETIAFSVSSVGVATINGSLNSGITYTTGNDILSTQNRSIKIGQNETFTYVSNGANCRYRWYLDDKTNLVSTSAVYTYKSTSPGDHKIYCYVNDNVNPYLCNVFSYYHESLSISFEDLAETLSNSSGVYGGFSRNGTKLNYVNDYPITATYTTFDKISDCSQIGLEPVVIPASEYLENAVLIIGVNAPLTSSSSSGWFGQAIERRSARKIQYVYCYKNVADYAFYGTTSLTSKNIVLGKNVTSVGVHSFGQSSIQSESDIVVRGKVTFNNSFSSI